MKIHATPKSTRPQSRDVALIRMLAENFRILNGEQIGELFPMGSVRRRNFRLKKLCDAGYLSTRSLVQMGNVTKHGYYLGPRAAELFVNPTERKIVNTIRVQVPQLAESGLAHRMLVDSVHIRFLTAGREYPEYKLLTWIDQYSPWWQELEKYGVPVQADAIESSVFRPRSVDLHSRQFGESASLRRERPNFAHDLGAFWVYITTEPALPVLGVCPKPLDAIQFKPLDAKNVRCIAEDIWAPRPQSKGRQDSRDARGVST